MSTWDESSQTLEPLIPLHHPSSLGIDSISIRPTNMFGLVWEDVLTSLRTNFQCKGFVMFCYIVFTPWISAISLDTVFLEKGHHGDSPSPARRGLAGEASCTMLYMGPICSNLRYIYSTWRFVVLIYEVFPVTMDREISGHFENPVPPGSIACLTSHVGRGPKHPEQGVAAQLLLRNTSVSMIYVTSWWL